jgi:hypothetical protein
MCAKNTKDIRFKVLIFNISSVNRIYIKMCNVRGFRMLTANDE